VTGPPVRALDGRAAGELASSVRQWLVDRAAEPTAASVATALREQGTAVGHQQLLEVLATLRAELSGAGPLQGLIEAGGCTDILVNGHQQLWIDDGDGLRPIPSPFQDEEQVRRLAQRLATAAGRRLDDAAPFCDARLLGGVRFHAALSPVATPGTLISLRLPAPRGLSLPELVERGALPAAGTAWLRALLDSRATFLISGGTGTGKTTLLSSLIELLPAHERILVLEDAPELRPRHPHVAALAGRPPNVEGEGEIRLADLVRQALRMRPDRIVVGEVRGPEVVAMLAAFNTGHDGGAATIHSGSVARVPARLEALAQAAGLPREAAHAQIAAGLDAVLHLERVGGVRRAAGIGEVIRNRSGGVEVREVVRFAADGAHAAQGSALVERLQEAGAPG
jgi:pilus assembly protein CpaF